MKQQTTEVETFLYKHIIKLPWVIAGIYTFSFSCVYEAGLLSLNGLFDFFITFFIFGTGWWFIFQSIDEFIVTRYRIKILARDPDIKYHMIKNKISEIENMTTEQKE